MPRSLVAVVDRRWKIRPPRPSVGVAVCRNPPRRLPFLGDWIAHRDPPGKRAPLEQIGVVRSDQNAKPARVLLGQGQQCRRQNRQVAEAGAIFHDDWFPRLNRCELIAERADRQLLPGLALAASQPVRVFGALATNSAIVDCGQHVPLPAGFALLLPRHWPPVLTGRWKKNRRRRLGLIPLAGFPESPVVRRSPAKIVQVGSLVRAVPRAESGRGALTPGHAVPRSFVQRHFTPPTLTQ